MSDCDEGRLIVLAGMAGRRSHLRHKDNDVTEPYEDATGFWRKDGTPADSIVIPAIQLYCAMREPQTVGAVAEVFRLTPERIAEAILGFPWLFIEAEGPLAQRLIYEDGE